MKRPRPEGRDLFRAVAPRLELAHRQRREEIAQRRRQLARLADRVLEYERLVAHRELQEIRAAERVSLSDKARRQYSKQRFKKLNRAREQLAAAQADLDAFVVDPYRRRAA